MKSKHLLRKIPALEALASEMVGDGQTPNVFFVTVEGRVSLVTRSVRLAYETWSRLHVLHRESAIEDRINGTIADVTYEAGRRIVTDDVRNFGFNI